MLDEDPPYSSALLIQCLINPLHLQGPYFHMQSHFAVLGVKTTTSIFFRGYTIQPITTTPTYGMIVCVCIVIAHSCLKLLDLLLWKGG